MPRTTSTPAPVRFIHPNDMPDRYAVTGRGTCMAPLIADGAMLVCDKTNEPASGDVVLIHFTEAFGRRYGSPGVAKRLITPPPPAGFSGYIVAEQLNPPRKYTFHTDDVLAVHKCIGLADAETSAGDMVRFSSNQEPPRC